jgi:hypothetical protein
MQEQRKNERQLHTLIDRSTPNLANAHYQITPSALLTKEHLHFQWQCTHHTSSLLSPLPLAMRRNGPHDGAEVRV